MLKLRISIPIILLHTTYCLHIEIIDFCKYLHECSK